MTQPIEPKQIPARAARVGDHVRATYTIEGVVKQADGMWLTIEYVSVDGGVVGNSVLVEPPAPRAGTVKTSVLLLGTDERTRRVEEVIDRVFTDPEMLPHEREHRRVEVERILAAADAIDDERQEARG
jgi:hypothetical protein